MRILYIDIDTLRPDHLGCYGYGRNTSPNIDSVAQEGMTFDACYASDAPCLPSRTALFSGRFGIHTGVVDHGGVAADPFPDGQSRGFTSHLGRTSFPAAMRAAGVPVTSVSSFAERHSAWWWSANFTEYFNPGGGGHESAETVTPIALDWLARNAERDDWFLHVHYWDPHTPYRVPEDFGNPFEDEPAPGWITEEVLDDHLQGAGPESAAEPTEFQSICRNVVSWREYPRQPTEMRTLTDVKQMFDGYDTGIRYVDDHVGRLLSLLDDRNLLDETAIVISSDHGENLGEQNIYAAHMTADDATVRVPLIMKIPGVTDGRAGVHENRLLYHVDFAATLIDLAGGTVPERWDGVSFAESLRRGESSGREYLVCSNLAGSCQRAVRFDDYLYVRTYHDGYHVLPDRQLFDVSVDPHQLRDLVSSSSDVADRGAVLLDRWLGDQMRTASYPQDPLWSVMHAGGPEHTRGCLPGYLERLRSTGRAHLAVELARRHPREH